MVGFWHADPGHAATRRAPGIYKLVTGPRCRAIPQRFPEKTLSFAGGNPLGSRGEDPGYRVSATGEADDGAGSRDPRPRRRRAVHPRDVRRPGREAMRQARAD